MHHTKFGKAVIRRAVRRFRHAAKLALRRYEEPERVISVSYTD